MKHWIRLLCLSLLSIVVGAASAQNVAKVGSTEYATIEEAVEAWGPGKTLTLLADVTTTSTVEVEVNKTKSTENWILNLGDYTWTADGCNAIHLFAAGGEPIHQNNGLKINANQSGGITASGKYAVSYTNQGTCSDSRGYRPRLEINGGTYNASYVVYYGTSAYSSTANGASVFINKSADGTEPVFNGNFGLSKCPVTVNAGYFNGTQFTVYRVSTTVEPNIYGGHFKTYSAFPVPGNDKGIVFGNYKVFVKSDASIDMTNGAPAVYEAKATKTLLLTPNQGKQYNDYIFYEKANDAIQNSITNSNNSTVEIILSQDVTATQDKTISRSGTLTIDATAEGSSYTGNVVLANNSAKLVMKFPEGGGHYGVSVNSGTLHVEESITDGIVTRTYSRIATISNPEAKVDNTSYSTVYDAFYAIDGTTDNKTIVLQKDVTNAGIVTNGTATGGDGKTVATFDLNGKSIGVTSVAAGNNANYTLTIIDSSEGKTGTVTNSDASLFILALTGISDYSGSYTLKVQAGTWQFDPSAVNVNGEIHNLVDEGYVAKDNGNGTWTVGEITPVAKIGEKGYPTLQSAVDAAQQIGGAVTVNIVDDISEETVTIKEVANFQLTIDGQKDASSNYTVDAVIVVDGLRGNGGSTTNGASVTLQNIAFVKTTATDGIQASHYPHHLTIQDCTYSGSDNDKWFLNASVDGPLYGVTVKNVTVEHARLIYANMSDDAVFQNITATNDIKVGFNVKTAGTALIENCQVTTSKYAFRDYSDGYAGTFTLKDNTFISTSEESDEGVIVNRGGVVGTTHINVESGTYTGHVKVLNNKEGVLAISGGYFSEEFPQNYIAEDLVAQGKVCAPATDKPGFFTIGDPHFVAQIGETKYVSLQAALDAAHEMTGDVTVELLDNIDGYSIVHQKAGLNLTIDGADKTLAGQIIIDGDGRSDGTDKLTIQNIKFEDDKSDFYTGTDAFILVPSTKTTGTPYYNNKNNYAHNVTVTNCSFTSTTSSFDVVGIKVTSGAAIYNVVISDNTGTKLHSLAQLNGATGGTITNNTVSGGESFVNVTGGAGEMSVSGNTFTSAEGADGYGIRENGSSSAVITLTDNTFTAVKAVVLGKGSSATNGTIKVESGTYVGDIKKDIAADATGKIVITDGHFSAPLADPAYAEFIADGLCGVNGLYPEDTAAPNGIGTAVASVTNGSTVITYASLEAAFAAAVDGSTITLLKSASGNGIVAPEGKFNTDGLTVDFGGFTYTVDGATVGSTGTETQAFQLLKDNKITFKNGTIYSEKALMLVQNYSDLTLQNMTLDGSALVGSGRYTLSNNNGNVVIENSTITAKAGDGNYAFDVCRYASYPSVSVTVKGESVINGDVEVSASGGDAKDGFNLMFEGGALNGKIVLDATAETAMAATPEIAKVSKSNALTAIAAPTDYKWVDNGDETSSLAPCVYVAQIGNVKYESLAEAVAAVPTDGTETTIVMIADETIEGNNGATIANTQNVILDLNGKTITLNIAEAKASQLITNKGTLTITDTSEGQNGKLTNAAGEDLPVGTWPNLNFATNIITNGGTLNVEAGTIQNNAKGSICYAIDNNSTTGNAILNMNGGLVTATGTVVRQFCNSTTYQNVINMTGGVVTTNGSAAIWTQLPGSSATSKKLATLNISGGEIIASSYAWYDYSYGDSFEAVEYHITGGKFTGRVFSYALKDGIISGFISGGLFSPEPSSSYIETPGYMFGPSEEVEGYYTLVPAEVDYSWTQNGKDYHDYTTFNTPFTKNYLMDGETITLLQDITLTEDLTWNTEGDATFTLNLGEFKITKGNFSIKLSPGQTVNASKSAAIFTTDEAGYYVKSTKNADETYTYTVEEADLMYTAANGTVSYLGWSNTVISGGGTYKLLRDVTAKARIVPGISASNVTLDLNGHTLTSTATDYAVLLSRNGTTSSHKTFALVDTSTEGGGKLIVNSEAQAAIQGSGKYNDITIGENVTIEGGCVALLSENQTLTVNGTINGGNDFAVATNGSSTKNTTITINEGAVLTSDVAAMYLPGNEGVETTINGGIITGGDTGIELRAGKLVVNGGDISSTATEYSSIANGNGTTTKGAAIAVVQHTTQLPIDVEVLGGSLTCLYNIAVSDVQNGSLTDDVEVTVKDELLGETILPTDYKWVSNGDGTSSLGLKEYVALIEGGAKYETLEEAFAAAQDGETITLLADCSGNGIIAPQGKFNTNGLTVDFAGFTYDVTGNLVGSTGTESQGFQLLKDNKITFKNGTVKSTDNAIFLVQNYSDLTLEGMTLTLSHSSRSDCYTLSNNNGNIVIDGTTINANEGGSFAFDVCRYASYPSVSVTVTGESVINGDVEISASGSDAKNGFNLMLDSGKINGDLVIDPSAAAAMEATPDKAVIREKDSFGQAAPADFKWVSDGEGTGTSTLKACEYIAAIGSTKYETLQEAVNAAGTSETTITLLTEAATNGVISGDGVVVPSGSNITFDLNGLTYDVAGETVGSTGTESNGFQLLQNSDITFKNGTLKATSPTAQMLIQNYSNLTLEDVNLDGTTLSGWAYALSNNCGTINLTGSTSITAKTGGRAFDTCKFGSYAIPTVNINTTGAITGPIEATGGKLNIKNGKFDVTWVTDNNYTAGDIQITGGIFSEEPDEEYCAEGYVTTDNEDEETKAVYPYAVMTKEDAGIYDLYDLLSSNTTHVPQKTPYTLEEDTPVKVVTYYREFSETTANTRQCWFVPFDYTLTAEDLEKCTFYRIHMFSAPANQEGVVEDEKDVVMKISELTAGYTLKANKPYIIKPKAKGVYEFVAENTTLKAKNTDELLSLATSIYEYDFYGVYDSYGPMAANQWFSLNTNGNLKWNSATQKLGPYRWYIKPTFTGDDYANISFIIEEEGEGDETTTIDQIFYDPNAEIEGFYTVGGIKLDKPVRGLNIVKYTDGRTKKVYVK